MSLVGDFTALVGSKGDDWFASWQTLMAKLEAVALLFEANASTSSTSRTIGTGSHTFTLDTELAAVPIGATLQSFSAADPTKYMIGEVTAISASSMSFTVGAGFTGGSGAVSDWVIGSPLASGLASLAGALGLNSSSSIEPRGNTGATLTIAAANYDVQSCTLDQNATLDFDPASSGELRTFLLLVSQDGTGGRAVTINFNSLGTNITEMNTAPTWTGQAASKLTRVAVEVESGKMRIWYEEVA